MIQLFGDSYIVWFYSRETFQFFNAQWKWYIIFHFSICSNSSLKVLHVNLLKLHLKVSSILVTLYWWNLIDKIFQRHCICETLHSVLHKKSLLNLKSSTVSSVPSSLFFQNNINIVQEQKFPKRSSLKMQSIRSSKRTHPKFETN